MREIATDGALVVEARRGVRKTLAPHQRLLVRGYAVTSYGSQGKTVDTVIMSDAANRAATDAHQWYVTISRARRKVVIFTPDKLALRAGVQQAGERELAMDLKLETPVSVDVHQSERAGRAMVAAQHHHEHLAIMARITNNQSNHQRIHL